MRNGQGPIGDEYHKGGYGAPPEQGGFYQPPHQQTYVPQQQGYMARGGGMRRNDGMNRSGGPRGGYSNGYANDQNSWSNSYNHGGGRGGGRGPPRNGMGYQNSNGGGWSNGFAAPIQPRNNRWQEDPPSYVPRGGGSRGNYSYAGYNSTSGVDYSGNGQDYITPLARDERVESELFATGNTGINFDKYEDIPVEATGEDVPKNITSVSSV